MRGEWMKVCGKHNLGYEDTLPGCPVCAGERLAGTLQTRIDPKNRIKPKREPVKLKIRQKLPETPPPEQTDAGCLPGRVRDY